MSTCFLNVGLFCIYLMLSLLGVKITLVPLIRPDTISFSSATLSLHILTRKLPNSTKCTIPLTIQRKHKKTAKNTYLRKILLKKRQYFKNHSKNEYTASLDSGFRACSGRLVIATLFLYPRSLFTAIL